MVLECDLDGADIIAFQRFNGKKQLSKVPLPFWAKLLLATSAASMMLPLALTIGSLASISEHPFEISAIVAPVVLIGVIGLATYIRVWAMQAYRFAALGAHLLGRERVTLTPEKIVVEYLNSGVVSSTPGLQSIEQDEARIFAFLDNLAAIVIPKRAFQSRQHEQDFIDKLRAYCRV